MEILDKNEKLIAVFRKHVFYIGLKVIGLILIALVPLVIFPILKSISPEFDEGAGLNNFLVLVYLLYLTGLWVIGFVMWTEYYLDMWLLTDKRLINFEQIGLFSRQVSSLRLDRIQDVKVEVSGMLDTFLHIGAVHVQTAGSEKEFVIPSAKNPDEVKSKILALHHSQVEAVQTVRIEETKPTLEGNVV